MSRAYPSLPAIGGTVESHTQALQLVKEGMEIHERRTANILDSFVSVRELVSLGLLSVRGSEVQRPEFPSVYIPTLLNSWVHYGGVPPYRGAHYYRDPFGRVYIGGLIRDGTAASGTVLFVLPPGFRPPSRLLFTTVSHDGANMIISRVDVLPSGEVQTLLGGNVWFNLSGVSFVASQ